MSTQLDLFHAAPAALAPQAAMPGFPPRATVDRVLHPQRGVCWAVHENGPSFLQLDDGAKIECAIRFGGCSSEPKRSWRSCQDPQYGRVELDVIQRGATHQRVSHREWGLGWIVSGARAEFGESRFEGDDGVVRAFDFNRIQAGTAAAIMREDRRKDKRYTLSDEEARWVTYTLRDGSVHEVRRAG